MRTNDARPLISAICVIALTLLWATQAAAAPIYASTVVDSTDSNFGAANVLGAPDGAVTNFYDASGALGFVVVSFGQLVADGLGDDIVVHLIDWLPGEDERFRVFASLDGNAFSLLGESGTPTGESQPATSTVGFDLANAGLATAGFLKLENARVALALASGEGPDIDALEALFPIESTAPEPTTLALIGLGLAGLGFSRRKFVLAA